MKILHLCSDYPFTKLYKELAQSLDATGLEQLFENYNLQNKIKLPINNILEIKNHKEHTFHQYVIFVEDRNRLQKYLNKKGIGTNVYYPLCLHLQKCFKYLGYKEGDFPIAEEASKHVLAIPMYPELTEEKQEYIVQKIFTFLNKGKSNVDRY